MTRQQRRAAERNALPTRYVSETSKPQPSEAQFTANRANAQLSSGPRTEEGKAISSHNALKTALTGRTVLLPTDNREEYQTLQTAFVDDYQPANELERGLVQALLDTTWRIQRILNLEFGLFAKGSIEFADSFPTLDPAARAQMIEVETFLKYEKSIRNLNTQEARLQRKLAKDLAELTRLQAERRQLEAKSPAKPEIGFEFANAASATPSLHLNHPAISADVEMPDRTIAA